MRSSNIDEGGAGAELAAARPGEDHIGESADYAVLGRGARIDREIHTGATVEVVAQAVVRTGGAPREAIVVVAVEYRVGAQITTQLDAGVGARNVEETGTIQGADPHVFDRFGLERAESEAKRPPIPTEGGHRFRSKATTQSDEGGHPVDRVRRGALSAI